jgi:hypothetical protein
MFGLSHLINDCYARALEARLSAKKTGTSRAKADFSAMEEQWLRLAKCYECIERVDDYLQAAE